MHGGLLFVCVCVSAQATGATAVLLGNVFMSSTLPPAPGSNGSSSPEVRRPLNFFAPDTRCVY